jgi:tRNA dimethylallyltransferase
MPVKPHAVLLFGPTAVGKTALLERLWGDGSQKNGGLPPAELINADSVQVYRGLDIGSAKPAKEFRQKIPHHLIDILDPREQFTAGAFVKAAETLIREILGRGRLPLVSGGTAFYFRSLVCGLPPTPAADARVRGELEEDCRRLGLAAMYSRLQELDPLSAGRVSANDRYRILRALEVCRVAGKPLSLHERPGKTRDDFSFLIIGLEREKEDLYRRIDSRVDEMFRAGLAGEVKALLRRGCAQTDPGMRGIGYREFFLPRGDGCLRLKDIARAIKTDSRRYAKRQITFFRSLPNVNWMQADREEEIRKLVSGFLARKN